MTSVTSVDTPRLSPQPDSKSVILDEVITKTLTETETTILFGVQSLCVALDDTELHNYISGKNKRYDELLNERRTAADKYRAQHQQTLNHSKKTKEVLAVPPAQESKGVHATVWDINDTFVHQAPPDYEQLESILVGL